MERTVYIDPIVEEVRKVRREIAERFPDDPEGFLRYMREIQDRYKDRLYYGKPKPAIKVAKRQ